MNKTPEQIVALVKAAGVIGAAGRGYPTHAKLESRADTVIINACECEPLLHADKYILSNFADDVIQGLKIAMTAVGAPHGVIAVNCEDTASPAALTKIFGNEKQEYARLDPKIKLHLMQDYYPAGDELLTVYDVTGRVVPEGGSPLDVGVLVLNVLTARQIYQAVNGIPATERTLTITGAVKNPKVVSVPVGARYSELIALAGGLARSENATTVTVLEGGPMMGTVVSDLESGIGKSTHAILVLPNTHFVVQMKTKTMDEVALQSKAVSGQGTMSTDLCPRHLLGHAIQPHEAMIALDYSKAEPASAITSSFLCSGCGVCELVGDEASFTSPKRVYAEYKLRLEKAGVQNPHRRAGFAVHSQFENRKLSIATLMMKLGLTEYARKPEYAGRAQPAGKREIALVRIPLDRHVGARSESNVVLHQRVKRGDLIAESPSDGLGAHYHSSIHGLVTDINDRFIEITGEPA